MVAISITNCMILFDLNMNIKKKVLKNQKCQIKIKAKYIYIFRDCRSNFNKSEETKRLFVTPMITGSQKREVCFWHRRIRPRRLLVRILSLTFIFLNFSKNNPKILGKQAGAIRTQWNLSLLFTQKISNYL